MLQRLQQATAAQLVFDEGELSQASVNLWSPLPSHGFTECYLPPVLSLKATNLG